MDKEESQRSNELGQNNDIKILIISNLKCLWFFLPHSNQYMKTRASFRKRGMRPLFVYLPLLESTVLRSVCRGKQTYLLASYVAF